MVTNKNPYIVFCVDEKTKGVISMTDKVLGNNQVNVYGEVVSNFTFSHEVYGEGFYMIHLSVRRLSNVYDTIPLMVSERLVDVSKDYRGKFFEASGQFRSYNRHEENRNRLILSVFVRDLRVDDEEGSSEKPNYIFLDGYICKTPVYRKTPLGREIADLLLAVNRPYGKSDYIPCICWGRNARFADSFQVGEHIQIWGRIQSREYQKKLGEDLFETRVAYEISVSKLEHIEEMSAVVAASEEQTDDTAEEPGTEDVSE